MARHTGQGDCPLTGPALAALQQDILGETTSLLQFGCRQSPVFVGESVRYQEIIHYIAPPPEDIDAMLAGLRRFLEQTSGTSPILRAAVISFGFVYLHPLADGNGRVHRFLINDILRRDGLVPDPLILPISAVLTDDPTERRRYDQLLDSISKPLMAACRHLISFTPQRARYPDGIESNIDFTGIDLARPLWRYPDLAPHALFLAELIKRSVTEQLHTESRYLRAYHRTRAAVKEIVEMPNAQIDRVLRVIEQNNGQLSNALTKELPILQRPGLWDDIVTAVRTTMIEMKN